MTDLSIAERRHDRRLPSDAEKLYDAASEIDADWTPALPQQVTESEVEEFIRGLADSGMYDDELGCPKSAPSIFHAVARQWVLDKEAVGDIIGSAFWRWAKGATQLALRGK